MEGDGQDLIGGGFGSLRIVLREDLDRTEEVGWNGGAGKLVS